jgi:hypothetical protein
MVVVHLPDDAAFSALLADGDTGRVTVRSAARSGRSPPMRGPTIVRMATHDQLWAWIYEPVQELKVRHRDDPDLGWDDLKSHALDKAGLRDPADHPLVEDLCRQLDEMPEDDRQRLLEDDGLDALVYELAGRHAEEAPVEPEPSFDPEQWYAYLAKSGPRWDGTEEAWAQFRDWFRYDAYQGGFGVPADAFLAEAEQEGKHEVFARYQVAVAATADGTAGDVGADETPDEVADVVARLDTDVVQPVLAELARSSPHLADLGEQNLRSLISQAVVEEIGRRATADGR